MRRLLSNGPLLNPDPDTASKTGGGSTDSISVSQADYQAFVAAKTRLTELEPQLQALTTKSKQADEDLAHISKLMRGDKDANASISYLMKRQGASDADIAAYLSSLESPETPSQKPASGRKGADSDESDADPAFEELRRDVGAMKASQAKLDRARLEGLLDTSIKSSLDKNTDLSVFLGALSKISPEEGEGAGSRLTQIHEDVRRETLDRLRARRSANGGNTWNDSWITEETEAATKAILGRLRTVVGDPSKMGRAPEASTGEDRFINKQPVPAPKPTKGMTIEKAQAATREWAVDGLLRAASQPSTGASAV